jgi:hypothetical protein
MLSTNYLFFKIYKVKIISMVYLYIKTFKIYLADLAAIVR